MPLVALNKRLGRRQRLSPPARIPANKVTLRKQGCMAHALSGKAVRALDLRPFMNFRIPCVRACFGPLLLVLCALASSPVIAQTASQVVVTASRTEQILTDALPHTTVLGRDAIEQSQLVDLPSLLAREAGFQFTQSGGRGSQATAFLRGAASMQVLVLVDGLPMTKQDTTGAVSLEHILLDQIERIEIVRGNVSAIYGSGAVGGVIQVFTRQGQTGPSAFATVEAGSLGTSRLSLGTQGKQGDWSYALSLSRLSTQGINAANLAQTQNANPDRDGYRNDSRHVQLAYAISSDHQLGLRSTAFDGRFDYDVAGSYAEPTDVHKGGTRIENNTVYWAARLGSQWTSRLSYAQGQERNITDTVGGYSFSTQAITRTRVISWTHQLQWADWTFTAGVDHQIQRIDTATDGAVDLFKQRTADAVYAGGLYSHGAHSLQINARHDDVQGLRGKDSSYIGYGHALSDEWKLIVSHATAFNLPPLGYLFDPYSGNPELRPETSSTQELGLQWARGHQRWRSTFFDTRTRDLLLYDMNTWQFSNVSSAKNRGLETSVSARWGSTDVRASLTLQDPVNEATGQTLLRRAKTLASTSVSHALGAWTLGGSVRYTGERSDIASNPRLPSYVLLDLTARYALSRDWTLFGRVDNALDSRYQTAYGYNQLPRTFTAGVSWKLQP